MSPSRTSKKTSSATSKKKAATKGQKKTAGRGSPAKASATKKAAKKKVVKKKVVKKKVVAKKAVKKKSAAKSKSTAKKSIKAPVAKKVPKKAANKVKTEKKKAVKKKAPSLPAYLKNKKWLASQRELLAEERAKYTRNAEMLAAEAAELMADREPGDVQFDEESGEGDTIAVERDRDLALSAQARESVVEIDMAFERMEAGTYGVCTTGGDFIPKERLEAIPEASVCVQHKTAMF